jgi:hypothetical protein
MKIICYHFVIFTLIQIIFGVWVILIALALELAIVALVLKNPNHFCSKKLKQLIL